MTHFLIHRTTVCFTENFHAPLKNSSRFYMCTTEETMLDIVLVNQHNIGECNALDMVSKLLGVSTCEFCSMFTFHMCACTRRVPGTLHDKSKCGPCKHVTGIHCSIVMVPHKITCKMKLQLSGTVLVSLLIIVIPTNFLNF